MQLLDTIRNILKEENIRLNLTWRNRITDVIPELDIIEQKDTSFTDDTYTKITLKILISLNHMRMICFANHRM